MSSFPGFRASVGLLVAAAALFVTTDDAHAQYYRRSCRSGYTSARYQPRYHDADLVYVDEPVVYVERIRPRRYVRYRYYSRPYHYYHHGTSFGHAIRHVFGGGHGHHRWRHGYHGSRHGHGGTRSHGHHGGHRRHGGHGRHSRH